MSKKNSTTTLVGKAVTLKSGEEVRVVEPSANAILMVLEDAPEILSKVVAIQGTENDVVTSVGKALLNSRSREMLFMLLASSTGKSPDEIKSYGLGDVLKIIAKLKDVMDWEDLKETFFQIVPPHLLSKMETSTKQMKTWLPFAN